MARPAGSAGPDRAYSPHSAAPQPRPPESLQSFQSRRRAARRRAPPLPRELCRLQQAGRLIGPGGATIKGLYERFPGVQIETGAAWEEHMFGVIEVAAPTAEALEACRLAIEQIVGFAVSPHAPSRVLLDLRADSPLLGKLRAERYAIASLTLTLTLTLTLALTRYAIASRVRASCGLMELEVP